MICELLDTQKWQTFFFIYALSERETLCAEIRCNIKLISFSVAPSKFFRAMPPPYASLLVGSLSGGAPSGRVLGRTAD